MRIKTHEWNSFGIDLRDNPNRVSRLAKEIKSFDIRNYISTVLIQDKCLIMIFIFVMKRENPLRINVIGSKITMAYDPFAVFLSIQVNF